MTDRDRAERLRAEATETYVVWCESWQDSPIIVVDEPAPRGRGGRGVHYPRQWVTTILHGTTLTATTATARDLTELWLDLADLIGPEEEDYRPIVLAVREYVDARLSERS
jgi:hypothetical protein